MGFAPVYADGKLAGQREQNVSFAQAVEAPDQVRIFFGDVWGNRGRVMIDEVQVSLVAHRPEELGYHVGPAESMNDTRLSLGGFDREQPCP